MHSPSSSHASRQATSSNTGHNFEFARALNATGAVIVHAEDYGPIREITGRGLVRPNGRFPSVKTGISHPFEAMHQRDLIHICEADPRVVDYISEPLRFEIRSTQGKLVYFPDLIRQLDDGSVEVIETKKTLDEVDRHPGYADKLSFVEEICDLLGWTFRVMVQQDVEVQPRLANARSIILDRSTSVSTADRLRVMDAMDDAGGWLCFGEAVAALSGHDNPDDGVARARLNALIVRRVVRVDIDKPIGHFTRVDLVAPTQNTLARVLSGLSR